MKKELILGLVLVVIVGAVIFFRLSNNQEITPQSATVQKEKKSSDYQGQPKKFSRDEVARHATKDDCYLIIEGKVYDVTAYIDRHPGGLVIARYCGKDATEAFNARGLEREPHSPRARKILKDFYLGDLE
ncbi:MAG: cytochrome b5 domain-containing protein [Patescibacteria group bacterium]|nr:cytochrome b5 domain-containing protein [Patescibacteria group bacterium]